MADQPPALPVARAVAHGAAACAVVAGVAMTWLYLPVPHDTVLALATVGAIGLLAAVGATLAERATRPPQPANDNDLIVDSPLVFLRFPAQAGVQAGTHRIFHLLE